MLLALHDSGGRKLHREFTGDHDHFVAQRPSGNGLQYRTGSDGGTTPYTWSLTWGTLPAGLTLNAATGVISGTPTATANATSLTFKVTDSSSPVQTQSVTLSLTVASSGSITVSVSPQQMGITIHQTLSLTATTTDSAGVNWSVTAPGVPELRAEPSRRPRA